MASYGYTFQSGDGVTPTRLNDARTISDIVNADIKSDAAIAATKLASDSITNTQIKSDAAIAGTKIAPAFGAQNITVGSADRSITNTTNHALAFGTNNTERMRIDSGGRALIGASTNIGFQSLQVHSVSPADVVGVYRWAGDSAGPRINLVKSRGTSVDTNTVVQNGDSLGLIRFQGADGSDTASIGASIEVAVDGTPGANDMPGRLVFSTTADGDSSPTERMRINSSGNVGIGTGSPGCRAVISVGTANSDAFQGAAGTVSIGNGTISGSVPAIVGNSSDGQGIRIVGRTADGNTAGDVNLDGRAASGSFTTLTNSAIRFSTNGVALMDILRNGSVGIGTTTPSAAARLDVSSTTQGFLPPRMTTAQRDAISTPPAGLVIYNTSTNVLNFYNGSAWGAV